MKTADYIKKIQNYIAVDELHSAIQEFRTLCQGTSMHNEAILISGRFSEYLRKVRNGIISFENANLLKAQISYNLVEMLDEIKQRKEEFEKEINKIEKEYIELTKRYADDMPVKALDTLSRDMKRLGQSLFDLDFVVDKLIISENKGIVFGALCAIQVNPNPLYFDKITAFISDISKTPDLCGFRLRIVYRLVMCLENIVNLDNYRTEKEIDGIKRKAGIEALESLAAHPICLNDDALNGKKGIGNRIEKTIKKVKLKG